MPQGSPSPDQELSKSSSAPLPACSIAVLIPCLNEAVAIRGVVEEYRKALPHARILVVDNGSEDSTASEAIAGGAEVIYESIRGKARAVTAAFAHLDEDLVLMVDGDGSYPPEGATLLLSSWAQRPADLVTGIRSPGLGSDLTAEQANVFRPMHQLGARAFERLLLMGFQYRTRDLFSGLRLMTRKFYKNVPILSRRFELEIELTIQAVDKGFSLSEVPIPFRSRAAGTESKLNTIGDGLRILRALFVLLRDYKPLFFFSSISAALLALGLLTGFLPVYEYFLTSWVGRFPLAILAASIVSLSVLTAFVGLILEGNLRHHRESYQIRIRNYQPPRSNE